MRKKWKKESMVINNTKYAHDDANSRKLKSLVDKLEENETEKMFEKAEVKEVAKRKESARQRGEVILDAIDDSNRPTFAAYTVQPA